MGLAKTTAAIERQTTKNIYKKTNKLFHKKTRSLLENCCYHNADEVHFLKDCQADLGLNAVEDAEKQEWLLNGDQHIPLYTRWCCSLSLGVLVEKEGP